MVVGARGLLIRLAMIRKISLPDEMREQTAPFPWYAVRCLGGAERRASRRVAAQVGCEVFYPYQTEVKRERHRGDVWRPSVREAPYFAGYFFASASIGHLWRLSPDQSNGIYEVIGPVKMGQDVVVVPNAVIDLLKGMAVEDPRKSTDKGYVRPQPGEVCVKVSRPLALRRGDRVVLDLPGSPLDGLRTVVAESEIGSHPQVKVFLNMLGSRRKVPMPREALAPVASSAA
jgi:hypothetical protein